jgi:hypothetical protein
MCARLLVCIIQVISTSILQSCSLTQRDFEMEFEYMSFGNYTLEWYYYTRTVLYLLHYNEFYTV